MTSSGQGATRREFLGYAAAAGAGAGWLDFPLALRSLVAAEDVGNPLEHYPARGWEKVYRDQYAYDSTFTWVCSPNDTHACRVKAYVRNGVITRLGNDYSYQDYKDLYGNHATPNWNPRQCAKGYTFHRRVYGPYRLKYPMVRVGWKEWADAGFPDLTAAERKRFRFDARGSDRFVRLSWDEAFDYLSRGLVAIARAYSGEAGATRLLAEGYPREMVAAMEEAGTRTMKFRGGMGLLGIFGKYGAYRFSNMLALLDERIRGVPHEKARGGRNWSNYTWHGDQAPGQPWVHGLQTSDCDFNDLRFSRLIVMDGKNLVENKMTDSHWFIECMERGAKVVVIAPEYGAPSTKADYWIPIRPGTDAALFLGITRWMMENGAYDEAFVKGFTDFPLLLRTDNLRLLRAHEVFPGYENRLSPEGPSLKTQNLTAEQYGKLGDFVVWDARKSAPASVTRDEIGGRMTGAGIDPVLEGRFEVPLADGSRVECLTVWTAYRKHLEDYDLDTVADITKSPKELILRLAQDFATIRPAAIHQGEGINHWFHATEMNRAAYLPLLLTGNIGRPGAGCHTWAGNYKAALFQGSPWTGPGFKGWVAEDPFEPNLDPKAHGREIKAHAFSKDEEPAYWNHGDRPLIVETPSEGRKVFTGKTHMPTPTKAIFCSNVNLFNNAKHAYEMFRNVNPRIDLIVTADINVTATVEYADFALPANSWVEFEGLEVTASCSNPFLQVWKGGIPPIFDTKDDLMILAGWAKRLGEVVGDERFAACWKFALEGKREVYIQRLLDTCTTTAGYRLEDILSGKYGVPGGALMLFRTYPRIPFWEQVHEDQPFFTSHGRLCAYADVPEAIEYGENFVVHREGTEATPFLPNVIVSRNPLVRPKDYGVPLTAESADERTVRNVKMAWAEVRGTENFLWKKGYRFWCLTPKTRHKVHSQWSDVDWHQIYDSNFGDPYRLDRRTPGNGESQLHMNPQAARDLGIEDGDYAYLDANPADRPYVGATPDDPFYRVARCMVRVIYNPAYPYNIVMMKHAPYIATERTVKAHESRADGLARSEDTGYPANLRYGSQQSVTRNWHMPMHQTDTLFHKAKAGVAFLFGGEADNHAVNTVPKETLVRVSKAEDGGLGGRGVWATARTGRTPGHENEAFRRYLEGGFTRRES